MLKFQYFFSFFTSLYICNFIFIAKKLYFYSIYFS
nr:MAG TPA: hypothetical protein [Caudoviricetes sp.]DAK27700.1 MAG TPA: hypothetical protein [Caudoviricetes sp.]